MSNRKPPPRRRHDDYWRAIIYALPPVVTYTTEIVFDEHWNAKQVYHPLRFITRKATK